MAGPLITRRQTLVGIGALAIPSPVVCGGLSKRHVENAALGVDGEEPPHIRPGAILPRVAFPGIAANFTGARD